MAPLCIDLFCGLGGWTEGFLAAGWRVIGFDIERHIYGEHRYPAQLVLQDVRTIHGSQFRWADMIVASSPCQEFSYRAMPWKRAKALPPPYFGMELFAQAARIQQEASAAAGRHIPMIQENVCGAQKWVGRARWHYGSYYLWGDVPALMPFSGRLATKEDVAPRANDETNFHSSAARAQNSAGGSWFAVANNTTSGHSRNPVEALAMEGVKNRDIDRYERNHPDAFGWKIPRTSSHSAARKAASARIAKIPFALSHYLAETFLPELAARAGEGVPGEGPG